MAMMMAEKNPPYGGFFVSVQIIYKDEGLSVFILEDGLDMPSGPNHLPFIQIKDFAGHTHVIRRFNRE